MLYKLLDWEISSLKSFFRLKTYLSLFKLCFQHSDFVEMVSTLTWLFHRYTIDKYKLQSVRYTHTY